MRPHTRHSPGEALKLVLKNATPLPTEQVEPPEALYRVLSEPLAARIEDPRFDKSAVDGIGIRADDRSTTFEVIGEVAAGTAAGHRLEHGEAIRIMTGAPVPRDVGQVVRLENCALEGSQAQIIRRERATNIALKGENISVGDLLMSPRRLLPQDIGVIVSQGYRSVPVRRRPRVAVIATGDEIYPYRDDLPPAGIYDSNSYQLEAFSRDAYAEVTHGGIVPDEPERIQEAIGTAIAAHDVVILTGGVSMGDYDFVPDALDRLGAQVVFHGLSMKPGWPTLYAVVRGGGRQTHVFGLPGNPVSTVVQFELLLRPLLWALAGADYVPRETRAPLAVEYTRNNADRHEFRPGILRDGTVVPLGYKGSGHISILAEATLFFRVDQGVSALDPGSEVYVRFLR